MKREKIIALLDECEEIVVKIGNDEDYATGVLINLSKKAERGEVAAAIKVGMIAGLLEEEGEIKK